MKCRAYRREQLAQTLGPREIGGQPAHAVGHVLARAGAEQQVGEVDVANRGRDVQRGVTVGRLRVHVGVTDLQEVPRDCDVALVHGRVERRAGATVYEPFAQNRTRLSVGGQLTS